jgi:chemotaxis protein methyltransferase CheR
MQALTVTLDPRPKLNEKDFTKISAFIHQHFGIKLPIEKLILVESRLIKRIMKRNLKSFSEYVDYTFSSQGEEEKEILIDFICTNKTDFFREDVHFKFLAKYLVEHKPAEVNLWSAACSSGEEPYTISMVLDHAKKSHSLASKYQILATDISSTILHKAIHGEYALKALENIPNEFHKNYFSINKGVASINQQIKKTVSFQKFNLVDDACYRDVKTFDFIFCRNVLIYFDHVTQGRVIGNLIDKLNPGGFLFLGHTETMFGRKFPVKQIQPTIYQKLHA